jgi:hypothetical protein
MASSIVGVLLVIAGLVLVFGAFPFARFAGRLWPRAHTRGSIDLLASSSFLGRFVGISLTLAGAGMILFEIISN